jgi:CO/xanthine dehydrogenase FAD-binding subunit
MKFLPPFEYISPGNVEELLSVLSQWGAEARILAGGTDLLVNLKKGEKAPKLLVDITRIRELNQIRDEGRYISIGATVTHAQLTGSGLIQREVPFLSEAARAIGSTQIRNVGTIGGNIANASPAADTLPPLVALNAEGLIFKSGEEQHISLAKLFVGPYKTILASGDMIAGVRFSKIPPWTGTSFLKLGRRKAMTIARISIAVALTVGEDERIQEARICPGAVMPFPARIIQAEDFLRGKFPKGDIFQRAGRIVASEMLRISGPRDSTPYKEPVLSILVQRALSAANERIGKR